MNSRPRYVYEVTEISIEPDQDRSSAILLLDTANPIDFSLRVSRDTLERLRDQIDGVLSDPTPYADQ